MKWGEWWLKSPQGLQPGRQGGIPPVCPGHCSPLPQPHALCKPRGSFSRCFLEPFPSCSWQKKAGTSQHLCKEQGGHRAGKGGWCLQEGDSWMWRCCGEGLVLCLEPENALQNHCMENAKHLITLSLPQNKAPFCVWHSWRLIKTQRLWGRQLPSWLRMDTSPRLLRARCQHIPNFCPFWGLSVSIGGTTEAAGDATQSFSPAQAAFLILPWSSLPQPPPALPPAQPCSWPCCAEALRRGAQWGATGSPGQLGWPTGHPVGPAPRGAPRPALPAPPHVLPLASCTCVLSL